MLFQFASLRLRWMSEWNSKTFESLIHNNNAVANVEKYHFLKQALHGEPEKKGCVR